MEIYFFIKRMLLGRYFLKRACIILDRKGFLKLSKVLLSVAILFSFSPDHIKAKDRYSAAPGNFGLPGIIDLPSARRFRDGELVFTHQNHKYLFMSGISFQALPRLGLSFRYGGLGLGGGFAQNRLTWDRSFSAHISLLDERKYLPAISLGLRDFIGTGWYTSEYIVGTKSIGRLEVTAGLGFGRLAGRDPFSNPLRVLSSTFNVRNSTSHYTGGTIGRNVGWFQGDASSFFGLRYQIGDRLSIESEYTSDLMLNESSYLDLKSPWNFGLTYKINNYLNLSAQYLHGSQIAAVAHIKVNPSRPPLLGGKELAPVPMRLRGEGAIPKTKNDETTIKKVLKVDRFKIHHLSFEENTVKISVTNTKFRSISQAVGRVASTLQRFTADNIKNAIISFHHKGIETARYQVDLEKITREQFNPTLHSYDKASIIAIESEPVHFPQKDTRFSWGVGPYIEHRLFNPDLPLSLETGLEVAGGYEFKPGLNLSGNIRKSVLTNLTDNQRLDSGSLLPRVHSSWPLYDLAGQSGHIHTLNLSYTKNLAPGFFARGHLGILGPFFAGIGAEVLYKPAQWPVGVGFDIHRVRQRDYDMLFDLLDYETTTGHLSVYYDAGGMFDIEINVGRYLARDWGATTTISRKFGSGWEVGGYATLTDVPFATFGEGSFDKAIYVSIPIDWIISSPDRTQRRLTLKPITRDGGARLSSARRLYRLIENSQNAALKREFGRLWK